MPRVAFYPKAIKSRIDDFVVSQNRAKRILSTAMHNQRLRIQQLEQYQRDLLSDEREHAEQLRREAANHQGSDPSVDILTDFEGQAEGYISASRQNGQKTCKSHLFVGSRGNGRSDVDTEKTAVVAGEVECHVIGADWVWKDSSDKEYGQISRYSHCYQRLHHFNTERYPSM